MVAKSTGRGNEKTGRASKATGTGGLAMLTERIKHN